MPRQDLEGESRMAGLAADDIKKLVADTVAEVMKNAVGELGKKQEKELKKRFDELVKARPGESEGEEKAADGQDAERRQREKLEKKIAEMEAREKALAEKAERTEREAAVRAQLAEHRVTKPDLALRAVKDDIFRGEDGKIYGRTEDGGEAPLAEYVKSWVQKNPEFLPPRIVGGTGATGNQGHRPGSPGFDLDQIRPGMSEEEKKAAYAAVSQVAEGFFKQ